MKKKILYISLLDWYFTKQRPQHIAELLSKKYDITYLCTTSWISKFNRKHDDDDIVSSNIRINENLNIRRVKYLPLERLYIISRINEIISVALVRFFCITFKPDIIWVTHPQQSKLIPRDYKGKLVYDCMDNYTEFLIDVSKKEKIMKLEKTLCIQADIILTSSNGLYEKISAYTHSAKIEIVKNATNFDVFYQYFISTSIKSKPKEISDSKKTIGYFGGISSWFDVDLILVLANDFRDCDIVIIGPVNNRTLLSRVKNVDNVKLLGPKVYSDLPRYLYYFDVCIMPFIVNDLIKDVNPVKVYEYLSMGKPVVAPNYDEIREFEELIYLADGHKDFSKKVQQALNEDNTYKKSNRIEFARSNTWKNRVDQIYNKLEKV
jgi:glycosyltransferase involved in cell wall biosynthesis